MADIFDDTVEQRAVDQLKLIRNALKTLANYTNPANPEVACILTFVNSHPELLPALRALQAIRGIMVTPKDTDYTSTVKGLGL